MFLKSVPLILSALPTACPLLLTATRPLHDQMTGRAAGRDAGAYQGLSLMAVRRRGRIVGVCVNLNQPYGSTAGAGCGL